jgi:Immunoglobulin-like domain of bacterial spore germination
MIKRAALALLLLSACAPAAAPPKEPEAPVVETPVAPAPVAGDAEKYKAAPAGEITVASPAAGARVTSPLVAEGSAINSWFFEGQFVAELVVNGEVLAQAPAMQAGDKSWTDPGPVGFKAELAFEVTKETNAELILSEDMPEFIDEANDIRGPARSVRIPVVLLPPAK